jgi:hypothetical protein
VRFSGSLATSSCSETNVRNSSAPLQKAVQVIDKAVHFLLGEIQRREGLNIAGFVDGPYLSGVDHIAVGADLPGRGRAATNY